MPQITCLVSARAGPHTQGTRTSVSAAGPHYPLPSTHRPLAAGKAAIYGSLSLTKTSFFYVSEISFRPVACERDLLTTAASTLPHLCQGKESGKCEGNPACGFGRLLLRSSGSVGALTIYAQGVSPPAPCGPLPAGFPSPVG